MQLVKCFSLLFLSLGFFVQSAPYNPDELNPNCSDSELKLFLIRRQLARSFIPERDFPEILSKLKDDCTSDNPDRFTSLVVLDSVMKEYGHFISLEDDWFKELLTDLMLNKKFTVLETVLEPIQNLEFLQSCLELNLTSDRNVYELLNDLIEKEEERVNAEAMIKAAIERADAEELAQAAVVAPPSPPTGPKMQLFKRSADGEFAQQISKLYADEETGYFHFGNATRVIMGIVEPPWSCIRMKDAPLDGSIDDFMRAMAGDLSTPYRKGMVLWYDRPSNRAILRRIKCESDPTAPVLGIYRPVSDDVYPYNPLEATMPVIASTRDDTSNTTSVEFKMESDFLVIGFPSEAVQKYKQYELDASISEFDFDGQDVEEAMEAGMEGVKTFFPDASFPLFAAHLQ